MSRNRVRIRSTVMGVDRQSFRAAPRSLPQDPSRLRGAVITGTVGDGGDQEVKVLDGSLRQGQHRGQPYDKPEIGIAEAR